MIQILGRFIPSHLDASVIASELRDWLRERSIVPLEPQIGVRCPEDTKRAVEATPVLLEWHRDGAGPDPTRRDVVPSIRKMILWSNGAPTEICTESGSRLKSGPFDVVLMDNVKLWHRAPLEEGRWFVGIYDPVFLECEGKL